MILLNLKEATPYQTEIKTERNNERKCIMSANKNEMEQECAELRMSLVECDEEITELLKQLNYLHQRRVNTFQSLKSLSEALGSIS